MNQIKKTNTSVPIIHLKLSSKISYILLGIVTLSALAVLNSYYSNCQGMILQALLVNFIFFGELATSMYAIAMIFLLTGVKWGAPLKRLAESGLILMVIIFLMLITLIGFEFFIVNLHQDRLSNTFNTFWFENTILGLRNVLLFGSLIFIAGTYSHSSYYVDDYLRKSKKQDTIYHLYFWITRQKGIAVLYLVLYVLNITNWSVDWIMMLDKSWISSLFGLHQIVSGLLSAGALLLIFSSFLKEVLKVNHYLNIDIFKVLIKWICVFGLIWAYFIFSQVLVIWYANIPHETEFLALRFLNQPWQTLSIIILIVLFVLPLLGLLSSKTEKNLHYYKKLSYLILIGVWLEKYLLVIPTLKTNTAFVQLIGTQTEPAGYLIMDFLMTTGLFALLILLVFLYFKRNPVYELENPVLKEFANQSKD